MDKQRWAKPFMWVVIAAGAAACLFSASRLSVAKLDLGFLFLALVTVAIASRIAIPMPGVSGRITVSDTFIFLTMLLYGGEPAVLLAAAEGLSTIQGIGKRPITFLFSSAVMACSTFLTVWALRFFFGPIADLPHAAFSAHFISALCLMGLVQYIANSALAAVAQALKTGQSVWQVWRKYCLWASLTYFAGSSAAVITAKLVAAVGFYGVVSIIPIVAILYLTYRTYLKNIEVMAASAKAEAEAAGRAEAAVAQAEQARRHVEELSHYIAEQERIREQFAQVEKMSALGELASGVAHDFNNTLTGILGRAQLLLRTQDPEKIESGLQIIIKTAKDGAKTIRRIQDFARQRRAHDFALVAVDHLLLDVSEITRPRWKNSAEAANVHINLNLQIHSNAFVLGDESELREVLVNLVFNAVDAMPEGGTLTLSAKEAGGAVEVCVADTGTGMSEEVRSRVFDPFFTTKGKTGMGLGLAVSFGIIRRHEGDVTVESEVGRGTCFRIKLPVATGQAPAQPTADSAAATPTPPLPAWAKLLVVDDEAHVRELLRDILEKEGHEVALAGEGREALVLFEQSTFDAVFTDLGLPGMSGWELARAVRERNGQIPLAIITGWGEAVGSAEQQAAGVNWVVTKPFTVERILAIAQEVARRRESPAGNATSTAAA